MARAFSFVPQREAAPPGQDEGPSGRFYAMLAADPGMLTSRRADVDIGDVGARGSSTARLPPRQASWSLGSRSGQEEPLGAVAPEVGAGTGSLSQQKAPEQMGIDYVAVTPCQYDQDIAP